MSTFRLQKVDNLDRPPKTLVLYEEDGIRVRRHRYVCPVRCIDCKHSYTAKAEGRLRRLCGIVLGYRDDDGYCDRGERRG
jgi:hypothetical protein